MKKAKTSPAMRKKATTAADRKLFALQILCAEMSGVNSAFLSLPRGTLNRGDHAVIMFLVGELRDKASRAYDSQYFTVNGKLNPWRGQLEPEEIEVPDPDPFNNMDGGDPEDLPF